VPAGVPFLIRRALPIDEAAVVDHGRILSGRCRDNDQAHDYYRKSFWSHSQLPKEKLIECCSLMKNKLNHKRKLELETIKRAPARLVRYRGIFSIFQPHPRTFPEASRKFNFTFSPAR